VKTHSARFLLSHRQLLIRVTSSELRARYAGSIFGIGWFVIAPVLLLSTYALVYLEILRVQVPGLSSESYVLYIFAGLVPYLATAEALSLGVGSVIANKAVLSNTVFPIDLAPPKAVLLSQGTMAVGLAITVVGAVLVGAAQWSVVFVPLIWLLQLASLIGLTWILSLLNVVFRDLQNLIGILLFMLLIVSPIAYTSEMVPSTLRPLIVLNPFAYFVVAYQKVIVLGVAPSVRELVVLLISGVGLFLVGGWFFGRAKALLIDYV
jgi:homopolymeric O-antigen transport system permease protein